MSIWWKLEIEGSVDEMGRGRGADGAVSVCGRTGAHGGRGG
jgi:hypothetical protein